MGPSVACGGRSSVRADFSDHPIYRCVDDIVGLGISVAGRGPPFLEKNFFFVLRSDSPEDLLERLTDVRPVLLQRQSKKMRWIDVERLGQAGYFVKRHLRFATLEHRDNIGFVVADFGGNLPLRLRALERLNLFVEVPCNRRIGIWQFGVRLHRHPMFPIDRPDRLRPMRREQHELRTPL